MKFILLLIVFFQINMKGAYNGNSYLIIGQKFRIIEQYIC
jgi:hypothetical protein